MEPSACQVGARLRTEGWNITRVVCSPYLRCAETAAEVVRALLASDEELAKKRPLTPTGPKGEREGGAEAPEAMSATSINIKRHFATQTMVRPQEMHGHATSGGPTGGVPHTHTVRMGNPHCGYGQPTLPKPVGLCIAQYC